VRAPAYLCVGEILDRFGSDPYEARRNYVDFVIGEYESTCDKVASFELAARAALAA